MATRWLIRWSGLVLIVGAVVLVIHQVSHPLGEAAAYTREATWVPSHLLGYLAFQLLAFGVVGLYARQAQATGSLGLVAFVLTTVGLVIAAGGQLMVGAVLQPLTAARTPELWDPDGPVSIDRSVRLVFGLANLWVPGLVLMAIATARARVLPRWPAWLIGVSATLGIVTVAVFDISPQFGASNAPFVAADVLEAILAVGLVGLGRALWDTPALPGPDLFEAAHRSG